MSYSSKVKSVLALLTHSLSGTDGSLMYSPVKVWRVMPEVFPQTQVLQMPIRQPLAG